MLSYLRFEVELEPDKHPDDPDRQPLTAALFRRVLGKALVDSSCPFGSPLCQPAPGPGDARPSPSQLCCLARSCPYGVLFAGSRSPRPPYALHLWPPMPGEVRRMIEVTLFGEACALYPWVLSALGRACRAGLGRARRRYQLREVSRLRPDRSFERLCSDDLSRLDAALAPDAIGPFVCPVQEPGPVEVRLLSPARFISDGRLLRGAEPVPFRVLIARVLDRLQSLYGQDCSEILQPHARRLLAAQASDVRLLQHRVEWVEVPDYSARSQTSMSMGGKVGWQLFAGEASGFLPILRAGEIVHVGKNPASGCGRLEAELLPPPTSAGLERRRNEN